MNARIDAKKDAKPNVKLATTQYLRHLGIQPNMLGYEYARSAILMVLEDKSLLYSITTELYPRLAKKYNSTPTKIERCIRNAIETAWANPLAEQRELFPAVQWEKGKPTNSEFIATVADDINLIYLDA